jgi:hypothetical protein
VGVKPHCQPQSGPGITRPLTVSFYGEGVEFLGGGFPDTGPNGTWSTGNDAAAVVPIPVGAGDLHVTVNFDLYA